MAVAFGSIYYYLWLTDTSLMGLSFYIQPDFLFVSAGFSNSLVALGKRETPLSRGQMDLPSHHI
jgi:hypothetical protein